MTQDEPYSTDNFAHIIAVRRKAQEAAKQRAEPNEDDLFLPGAAIALCVVAMVVVIALHQWGLIQ